MGQMSILDNFPNPQNPTATSYVKPKDQLDVAESRRQEERCAPVKYAAPLLNTLRHC